MKTLKILSHPYLLLSLFSLILISGKSFGGIYLMYLAMALPHGGAHALLALAGVAVLIFTRERYHRQKQVVLEPILNISGAFLLVGSLLYFFSQSRYNWGTFEQTVPLVMLSLFGVCWFLFVVWNMMPGTGNLVGSKMVIT